MPRNDDYPLFTRFTGEPPPEEETYPQKPAPKEEDEPISVFDLDMRIRREVEGATFGTRVHGEITNVKEVGSGHVYFVLKDEERDASINCVLYRMAPVRSRKQVVDGNRVVLKGKATLYAPRGSLQFIADQVEPKGRGALLVALEKLKKKLHGEGLFARERKRSLPKDPKVVGVVTSKDGAAIHDIVKVAFRRSRVKIVLAPSPVQGPNAAEGLARALRMLSRHPEVTAIILGRGGGSSDDLSAFNDEALVRAVAACPVPVISAIGHEVDVTLVDLAADARASTPSQAAEILLPDVQNQVTTLKELTRRLTVSIEEVLEQNRAMLEDRTESLESAVREAVRERRYQQEKLERRLVARHPQRVLADAKAEIRALSERSHRAMLMSLARRKREFIGRAARLDALSPLSVLGRGYSLATRVDGKVIQSSKEVSEGDSVTVRVAEGSFAARVTEVHSVHPQERPRGDR